jgi:RNA polymerase sigma factor for flagellar operon FliA
MTDQKAPYAKSAKDRESLIEEYIPLVKYLAHRISIKLPNHVEIDDLVNSGIIGLIDAIEKFDPSRGIKFKTYAEFRVRGAIFDGLRSLDWVPRSVRKQKKMVEESYAQLEQKLGRHATDEELSQSLGVGLEEFYKILDNLKGVNLGKFVELHNNDSQTSMDGDTAIAFIPDRSVEDPYHKFQKHELTEILAEAIRNLPDKERYVVSLYYFDELTMKEIGTVLNITESRVSQLHTKSMLRLRENLKTYVDAKGRPSSKPPVKTRAMR